MAEEQSDYEITVGLLRALKQMGSDIQARGADLTAEQMKVWGQAIEGRSGLALAYLEDLRKRGRI